LRQREKERDEVLKQKTNKERGRDCDFFDKEQAKRASNDWDITRKRYWRFQLQKINPDKLIIDNRGPSLHEPKIKLETEQGEVEEQKEPERIEPVEEEPLEPVTRA
jgi:hypothetical protein